MKVTFFGTSHGVPSATRFCSCAMLEAGGNTYLIDCGAPAVEKLLRLGKELRTLKAVFLTHSHGDHCNSLINLVDLSNWYFKDMSYDVYFPEPELGKKLADLIEYTSNVNIDSERIRFKRAFDGPVYDDGTVKITYIATEHLDTWKRPAYAVLAEAEGKSVLFTGDLSYMLRGKDFPTVASERELDGVVCELAHFGIPELKPYLEKCKAKRLFFTHVFPLEKFDDIEKAKHDYTFPISAVNDDDTIEF